MITDNVLVAYECFHTIRNKREGKEGMCEARSTTLLSVRLPSPLAISAAAFSSGRASINDHQCVSHPFPTHVRQIQSCFPSERAHSCVYEPGHPARRHYSTLICPLCWRQSSPITPLPRRRHPYANRPCRDGQALLTDLSPAKTKEECVERKSWESAWDHYKWVEVDALRKVEPVAISECLPPSNATSARISAASLAEMDDGLQKCGLLPHQGRTSVRRPRDRGSRPGSRSILRMWGHFQTKEPIALNCSYNPC